MMTWKLKQTQEGAVEVKDGHPVYVDETGKESVIDPNQLHTKILEVNQESKSRREKLQELEKRLTVVKDIEDLPTFMESAAKALETVKNLEDAQLVKAGEVEKIKKDAIRGLEEQEAKLKQMFAQREDALQKEMTKRDQNIRKLLISNRFANNTLFSGPDRKTHLLPDFAEARFGHHFDVIEKKNGQLSVIAKDVNGDVITSQDPRKIGEPADFDEAIEIIFNQYPGKDQLLRAGSGGSGATGGSDGVHRGSPALELRRLYEQAMKEGNVENATMIKSRLFELQRKGG